MQVPFCVVEEVSGDFQVPNRFREVWNTLLGLNKGELSHSRQAKDHYQVPNSIDGGAAVGAKPMVQDKPL